MNRVQQILNGVLIAALALAVPRIGLSQSRPAGDTSALAVTRGLVSRPSAGPRPYNDVITAKAKTDRGLFMVHKLDDRYFFEISDSLLGQDILVVNRISKAAAGGRAQMVGYAGDQIGENVIRFEKGPNNKVYMKNISFQEMSSDTTENGMYRSVINSNLQPLVASFDVKAYSKDGKGVVIDFTDYSNGDNDILFFESGVKRALSLGQLLPDRSYIDTIRSHPLNIEIRTLKTYSKTSSSLLGMPGTGGGSSTPATYELNSSMVLLPRVPMRPRYADPRVGYFATGYTDFDKDPQGVKRVTMITRWRLEPKEEDLEKYKRGELVEPKKPIVYYIDPATPKKWVPYLIQGVNDWQKAFEQAGFKNAIVARPAPTDPDWSIEDARHSVIVYKPSDIANASGPHVHDPRSGEILETHIDWYHNIMVALRNWYFVQTAAVDPLARKMMFDDELMGQLIRFVASHEVGHTLGLRHNFGASSTVPVEKLRDKKWVEENGHTPSIMDYARFNYVAQPEDNIGRAGLFPRIGDYDKWAIEWGYRLFPDTKSPEDEKPGLNKWVIEKLGNKRLWFGTETDANDPRGQNEDVGDNAMLAGAYGIKNLKRILPNLLEWTKEENAGYENAKSMYNQVTQQFSRYMGHVAKNIGGMTTTPKMIEEGGMVYEYVTETTQKEAMQFLHQQLFTTPKWLLDKKLTTLAGVGDMNTIAAVQDPVLSRLLSGNTINKLLQSEAFEPSKAYTAAEMLNDLKRGIWSELNKHLPVDIYRRNLQKMYVEKLVNLVNPPAPQGLAIILAPTGLSKTNDALSLLKGHMRSLAADIGNALPSMQDHSTRLHLQDVMERITQALDPGRK